MFKYFTPVALLCVALLLSNQAWSSIGSIVLATGQVDIQRGDAWIEAKSGTALFEQDKILTRHNSRAQLRFSDDTVITLGSQTEFAIDAFLNEGARNSDVKFNIATGTFKAITGKVGKLAPEKFTVKTRTATIGIRGTIFTGRISADQETIATLNGMISVTEDQTGLSVNVPAGQMTNVIPGQAPQPPAPFSTGDLDAISDSSNDEPSSENNSTDAEQVNDAQAIDASATNASESTTNSPAQSGLASTPTDSAIPSTADLALTAQVDQNISESINVKTNGESLKVSFSDFSATRVLDRSSSCYEPYGCYQFDSFDNWTKLPGTLEGDFENYIGWGSWTQDGMTGVWVGGSQAQAAAAHIEGLMQGVNPVTYEYQGGLIGEVIQAGDFNQAIMSSSLNLQIVFGSTPIVSGDLTIETDSTRWEMNLYGGIYPQDGGLVIDTTGQFFLNRELVDEMASGNMRGQFFGPNAESVGGAFNLETTNQDFQATGVFKATK